MNFAKLVVAILCCFLVAPSCGTNPPPGPVPPGPPVTNCSCADLCANLDKLSCEESSPYCVANCEEADSLERLHGIIPNHCCATAAASCETARQCE